jgi:GNAT superfamily N-acetyltransferase
MANVKIRQEIPSCLPEYARIPSAFESTQVFDVTPAGAGAAAFELSARCTSAPFRKDYDQVSGEGPAFWPQQFDVSNWGFFLARMAGELVGAAAIACNTPGVDMLEGRSDLAFLWDIRVAPEAQRTGVGSQLFRAAEAWARERGCTELMIETQNNNVPACRFYSSKGCTLKAAIPSAYPKFPDEIQLLWHKPLRSAASCAG